MFIPFVLFVLQTEIVNNPPLVLILITTQAESILQRNEVRRTWISWTARYRVQAYFFMGLDKKQPKYQYIFEVEK